MTPPQSSRSTELGARAHYAYLFEAKGIQSFIGDSGKLVSIAGGSDLIAAVASSDGDDLLGRVLDRFPDLELSRRAGASFCVHGTDVGTMRVFRDAWLIAFGMYVPGLSYVDVLTGPHNSSAEARRTAYERQGGVRRGGSATLLPSGRPGIRLDPRTGRPASLIDTHAEGEAKERSAAQTTRQGRHLAGAARHKYRNSLGRRILTDTDNMRFPRQFELKDAEPRNPAFPFREGTEDRRIGVVHADISGLGQLFIEISNRLEDPADVLKVATAIEAAIEGAAQAASGPVADKALQFPTDAGEARDRERWLRHFGYDPQKSAPERTPGLLPMRPVLLGGDDVTVIVRADLAIGFAQQFLDTLERVSDSTLRKLWDEIGLSANPPCTKLTACAGVAIVSASHPYMMAEHIADGMCRSAKGVVKRIAAERSHFPAPAPSPPPVSALTFAVVPNAGGESYEDYRKREQVAGDIALSAAPYVVGAKDVDTSSLHPIERLFKVQDALQQFNGLQGFREAVHAMGSDGERKLQRAAEVAHADTAVGFGALAVALGLDFELEGVEAGRGANNTVHIPLDRVGLLADALELIDIAATPLPAQLEAT